MKKRTLWSLLGMFVFLLIGGVTAFAQQSSPTPTQTTQQENQNQTESQTYTVNLSPLNDSGVTGQATITNQDGQWRITVNAQGLEEGQVHQQHIHGLSGQQVSSCPSMDDDANDDGILTLEETRGTTGDVVLALEPFPTADSNGRISYQNTFSNLDNAMPLENRIIELHGMTVDGEYQATLPVACGEITLGGQGGSPGTTDDQQAQGGSAGDTTMPQQAPDTGRGEL